MDVNEPKAPRVKHAALLAAVSALVFVALIVLIHRNSPRTLVSFHGLLHASIADGFASGTRVGTPPENPFFAGEPLCYYWFFQAVAGVLARLLEINVFHALEALVCVAAATLCVTAVVLGCRLWRNAWAGAAIAFLVVAGTNPLGFVFAAVKVARDGMVRLQDDPNYLWGVVHPLYGLIRFNDTGGLYGPMMNFFLNITSRPAALASLLVTLAVLHRFVASARRSSHLLLAVVTALTTALSPVLGLAGAFTLCTATGIAALIIQGRPKENDCYAPITTSTFVGAVVAMAFGALLALPTYYHLILGPSESSARFWLHTREGIKHAATVMMSVAPLLLLAVWGWRRSQTMVRVFLLVLLIAGVQLLAICLAVELPAWNQSNCFHAAVVMLAVPAAASIVRTSGSDHLAKVRTRRAIGLGLVFAPTVLLLLASYVQRPPVPVSFAGRRIARTPADSALAKVYRWVDAETSSDAIFIVNPNPPYLRVCGNSAEFPAMTGRTIFTDYLGHYVVKPYADARLRVDMASRLSAGEPVTEQDIAYLSDLRRPVYLLIRDLDDEVQRSRLQSIHGLPVYQVDNFTVYRVRTAEQTPT